MKSFDCKQCKVSADRSIFLTNLFKKLSRGGKEQMAEATVSGCRIASARFPTQGSTWDHWVKFTQADGSELELLATAELFESLAVGQTGAITWQGDTILSFEPKE